MFLRAVKAEAQQSFQQTERAIDVRQEEQLIPKNSLRTRLKQHQCLIERPNAGTEVHRHFRQHKSDNMLVSGLEAGLHWTRGQRLFKESQWIKKLKTMMPLSLNETN